MHPPPYCHFFYLLTRKLVDKIGSLVSAAVCIFQNKHIDFKAFWRDFDSVFGGIWCRYLVMDIGVCIGKFV
jgi:hypothetical protein